MKTYWDAFEQFKETSKEKELIISLIKKNVEINLNHTILDIGSEKGTISKGIQSNYKNITLVDILEHKEPEATYIKQKFEDVELSENYDIIIASHVWGHFSSEGNSEKVMGKIKNSLKSDGLLILCYNTNSGFMGKYCEFMEPILPESVFDKFDYNLINNSVYHEENFNVLVKESSFEELADMSRFLFIDKENTYNRRLPEIAKFLQSNLENPEFQLKQKLVFAKKVKPC